MFIKKEKAFCILLQPPLWPVSLHLACLLLDGDMIFVDGFNSEGQICITLMVQSS